MSLTTFILTTDHTMLFSHRRKGGDFLKIKIICLIVFCLVFAFVTGSIFWSATTGTSAAELSKQLFSSLVAGLVSFTGLLITISFQNKQTLDKQLNDIQPCFVVIPEGIAGAERPQSYFQQQDDYWICSSASILRTTSVQIKNVKNSAFAINATLTDNLKKKKYPLGNVENSPIKCNLALSKGDSTFFVFFEDVYGTKYGQEICYRYNNQQKNYTFMVKRPTKE